MKRPLVVVALLYVGGILLGGLPVPLPPLFVIFFVVFALALGWTRARPALICALLVLAGWINLAERAAILSPNDLRRRNVSDDGELDFIRGRLSETPIRRVHKDKDKEFWNSMAQVEVSEISRDGQNWQPVYGRIVTSTKGRLPDSYFGGQTVGLYGVLRRVKDPVARGLFDYGAYLRNQGIYHQLRMDGAQAWELLSSPARPPLADRFQAWGRRTLALGLPAEDESLRLEWALTLGWKAALTDDVAEPFIRAAT